MVYLINSVTKVVFLAFLLRRRYEKEEDFVMGLSIYMACLREKKRYSTAKSYQDALNSFKCFCGMEAIPYAYINRNRLLCYQSWLLDKGRSLNTVSTYMRRIRHIYNLAVEANEAPFVPNLFKDVFTGVESKRKKRCRERCWSVCLTPRWRIRPCGVYS
mgnify:CR=1 FL=1